MNFGFYFFTFAFGVMEVIFGLVKRKRWITFFSSILALGFGTLILMTILLINGIK